MVYKSVFLDMKRINQRSGVGKRLEDLDYESSLDRLREFDRLYSHKDIKIRLISFLRRRTKDMDEYKLQLSLNYLMDEFVLCNHSANAEVGFAIQSRKIGLIEDVDIHLAYASRYISRACANINLQEVVYSTERRKEDDFEKITLSPMYLKALKESLNELRNNIELVRDNPNINENIFKLQRKLKEAKSEQRFEECAEIRDRLTELGFQD